MFVHHAAQLGEELHDRLAFEGRVAEAEPLGELKTIFFRSVQEEVLLQELRQGGEPLLVRESEELAEFRELFNGGGQQASISSRH